MEKLGFYHDITGRAIDDLFSPQKIGREIHPVDDNDPALRGQGFIFKGTKPSSLTKAASLSTLLDFQANKPASGLYAQTIAFIAITQAVSCTRGCHVFQPETSWVNGHRYKMDILITIQDEVHNIEVKNNLPQLAPTSDKIRKLCRNAGRGLAPNLVCRIATVGTKQQIMKLNGLVAELGKLIFMDTDNDQTLSCKAAVSSLKLQDLIHWAPPIRLDSREYNGADFMSAVRTEPLSIPQIASAATQVPDFIQSKVNAMIRLLWINGRFRQAYNYPEGSRAAIMINSLLVQYAYKKLIDNAPTQFDIDILFSSASARIRQPLLKKLVDDKASFERQFTEEWENLKYIGFVNKRKNTVWVDDASRPELWLTTKSRSPQDLAERILS
jgi:hypothetical protein